MKTKVTGIIEAVFVEHMQGVAKATGKPYNFVNLSNGIEKLAFNAMFNKDETEKISSGEVVTCEVEIDAWNPRNNTVKSILNN